MATDYTLRKEARYAEQPLSKKELKVIRKYPKRTASEIAYKHGLTLGTVNVMIQRARHCFQL